jgi:hypothetical protein
VIFNLFSNDWDEHRANPGSAWSRASVGRRLGGELLGASLYHLPPGQWSWPYHAHYGNEELLVVLDGRPTLRTPDGRARVAGRRHDDLSAPARGRSPGHQPLRSAGTVRDGLDDGSPRGRALPGHRQDRPLRRRRPCPARTHRSSSSSTRATQPTTANSSTQALDDDPSGPTRGSSRAPATAGSSAPATARRATGQVLDCEAPEHLTVSWQITPDFRPGPVARRASRVEVRFAAEAPDCTTVTLVHRELARHREDSYAMVDAVAYAWPGIMPSSPAQAQPPPHTELHQLLLFGRSCFVSAHGQRDSCARDLRRGERGLTMTG